MSIAQKHRKLIQIIKSRDLQLSKTTLVDMLPYYQKLKQKIDRDKERGYKGDRKGNEVCLPNPETWSELGNTIAEAAEIPAAAPEQMTPRGASKAASLLPSSLYGVSTKPSEI